MTIADHYQIILILAVVCSFFMAWGVGANDAANAMATSVGSKAITLKHAIVIAIIFEFLGAFLAGGEVTETVRKGILHTEMLHDNGMTLILGMLASLLAAGSWLLIASLKGWPVSTTHSIIGAIVGFGLFVLGKEAVQWSTIGAIVASWVISPVISGIIAFCLFLSVQYLILNKNNVYQAAVHYIPFYMFFTAFIISLITIRKGLQHVGLNLSNLEGLGLSLIISIGCTIAGIFFIRQINDFTHGGRFNHPVERIFTLLMVFTACAMAFAHGSNDVANAVGPLSAIFSTLMHNGKITPLSHTSSWILLVGALGIALGLMTMGYRVMATVGQKITELTPSCGFAAELATASTVVIASGTGIPVSTTHTLIGAVVGVGLVKGAKHLNWSIIRSIILSWVITIPIGAILSIIFYFILKYLLG